MTRLVAVLLLLVVSLPASGQDASPSRTGSEARVFLMTFGPGAQVWERFGHNALWVHDPVARTDVAYHYGLFDMSEEGFLLNFLRGRMAYSMGAADAGLLLEAYRRAGRSATIQELALTPGEVQELRSFLEWNLRPENRVYRYDYFRDNCSTRIRDALDRVLDGALSDALRARDTPLTWRREALALTAEDELLTAGMDLGLGPLADRDITRWELAFIPMRLRDDLRDVAVRRDGVALPLVVGERDLPAEGAADESLAVPRGAVDARVVWMLVLGIAGAALFAMLGWLATQGPDAGRSRVAARWGLAAAGAFWGLLTGVLGGILLALWTLTDHEFAWSNENLLQANPLALALVVLVPMAVARVGGPSGSSDDPRAGAARAAFLVAAALSALSLLGLLLHPLPVTPQANLAIVAAALPAHVGLLYALARVRGRPGAASPRR